MCGSHVDYSEWETLSFPWDISCSWAAGLTEVYQQATLVWGQSFCGFILNALIAKRSNFVLIL